MTDVVLTPITSGYNLSKINANFVKIEEAINQDILQIRGGNNTMDQSLDMNGYSLLNVEIDPSDPESLITVGEADARYYNVSGDTLAGPMDVNLQTISGLRAPVGATEPVRKLDLDNEVSTRQAADEALYTGYTTADANIQDQLTGNVPLEASAFSTISWHDQVILNSVTIPDNKNAWSFGPTMSVDVGATVTIGTGSFWTIADGQVV